MVCRRFEMGELILTTTAILAVITAGALVGIDQLLKVWAANALAGGAIALIPGVLSLTYHENFGAAFGILQNQQFFLVGITSLVMLCGVVLLFSGWVKSMLLMWSIALVLGGGVGNLIDRVWRGYVVDYVYFEPINFPIFNFADSCVVVGTGLIMLYILFFEGKAKPGIR